MRDLTINVGDSRFNVRVAAVVQAEDHILLARPNNKDW
jgi:hypothetical protein